MKILITGGAGYIGSVLTGALLEKNHEVTVLDNLMYNQTSLHIYSHYKTFNFVFGDVRDTQLLTELVNYNDLIIPLAAIVGFPACDRDPELAEMVNYQHVKRIAELVRGTNKKIIYPNTNSGYGVGGNTICDEESPLRPVSHYGKTKVKAEKQVLSAGGISLRLATVFGTSPRMRMDLLVNEFVYKAVSDKYITLFEKKFVRNYVHIRDVVSAFLHVLDLYQFTKGQIYNVGLSDANLTKEELCEKIKEHIPTFTIFSDDSFEDPDKRDYIVSNQKIEETGWKPKYTIDDGIEELIKTYSILIKDLSSGYRNDFPLSYGTK
jgi:nucleoside-diphosphate-sugar epimerase